MIENIDGTVCIIKTVKPQDDFTLESLLAYEKFMEGIEYDI